MKQGKIPQELIDFAKEVVELAKARNVLSLKMEFRPGFKGAPWSDRVVVDWNRGRHDEPASVHIESKQHEYLQV